VRDLDKESRHGLPKAKDKIIDGTAGREPSMFAEVIVSMHVRLFIVRPKLRYRNIIIDCLIERRGGFRQNGAQYIVARFGCDCFCSSTTITGPQHVAAGLRWPCAPSV